MQAAAQPRSTRAVALLLLLCVAAGPALAQWKWKDAAGRVQYSDMPPPREVADKDILARPPAATTVAPARAAAASDAASTAASAPKLVDPVLEARRRQAEAAEAARRKAEDDKVARQKQDNCQRAREAVRTYESGLRIARVNPQGEREFLDDAQRARELARMKEVVASDCR